VGRSKSFKSVNVQKIIVKPLCKIDVRSQNTYGPYIIKPLIGEMLRWLAADESSACL